MESIRCLLGVSIYLTARTVLQTKLFLPSKMQQPVIDWLNGDLIIYIWGPLCIKNYPKSVWPIAMTHITNSLIYITNIVIYNRKMKTLISFVVVQNKARFTQRFLTCILVSKTHVSCVIYSPKMH